MHGVRHAQVQYIQDRTVQEITILDWSLQHSWVLNSYISTQYSDDTETQTKNCHIDKTEKLIIERKLFMVSELTI